MLRFIETLNIKNQADHTINFEDVPYVALRLRIRAIKPAVAIVEANCPRIRARLGSIEMANCEWVNLRKLNDLLTGKPEINDGGAGVLSTYGIKIPLFHPEAPNAVHKRPKDNMHFYSAKFGVDDCTYAYMDVYGEVDEDMPESYIPKLHDYEFTASTGEHKILLKEKNLAMLMLTEPGTAPDTIALWVGDRFYGSADWPNWENHTNDLARIEATALDVILFDMVQKRNFSDVLSDSAKLHLTGGAGSMYYMTQNIVFDTGRAERSVERVRASINSRIQQMAETEPDGAVLATMQNVGIITPATLRKVRREVSDPRIRAKITTLESRIAETE